MMNAESMRERIIKSATRLFAKQGYNGTSVRQIVEAVGTTKPTLYYHFGNKEGLYREALDFYFTSWIEFIQEVAQEEASVQDRLIAVMNESLSLVREQPEVMLFMLRVRMEQFGQGEDIPNVDLKLPHEEYLNVLMPLLAEGIENGELIPSEPRDATFAFMGMLNFWMLAGLEGHCAPPDVTTRILRFLVKGDAR